MNQDLYPLLAKISSPNDLRQLSKDKLAQVCEELRRYLLNCVSRSSGHLASGLGVVELTVALHYIYQTPFDHIIWDVGHQAYPHKILTGRREQMDTIRQKNGLCSFPDRDESPYDVLTVGHSTTSISAGLGLAISAEQERQGRKTICVIGDGALTAGMAFEAMNHAGDLHKDLLVILNDNDMSISKNVGALNKNLLQLLTGKAYSSLRENSKKVFSTVPTLKQLLKRTEEHLKGMVAPATLFEELGFNYLGPIDGHDINSLASILHNIRQLSGPQFLHVITKKGKGYTPAEQDPIKWHGVPKFDPSTGNFPHCENAIPTYSAIFGQWLCETAANDKKLMAITPAMAEGSGMAKFAINYPQQFFDVAIAEQHAVTFAAGLAIGGFKPVVAIYSTFLQRAYDQLIHDVALQNLPVLFAIDRAGIVGADGKTHQGAFDLSFLRCIPNLVIMAPSDENECRLMLHTGYHLSGPAAVRYPRECGTGIALTSLEKLKLGKAVLHRQGEKIAILNFGTLLREVLKIAEKMNATVIDMRFIKPLDTGIIAKMAFSHHLIVTLEDNAIMGGAGSAVNEELAKQHHNVAILNLGLPDIFIPQGSREEVLHDLGLDAEGIKLSIIKKLNEISQID